MKKLACLIIHTERLHSESSWKKTENILKFFKKHEVRASWFSMNPAFVGFEFDELKWIKGLNILKSYNQDIQLHTHFYKGKRGVFKGEGYDLDKENVEERIKEDKEWLKNKAGVNVSCFSSGAFKMNKVVLDVLNREGFECDFTLRDPHLNIHGDVWQIPTLSRFKDILKRKRFLKTGNCIFTTIYFHDYDLEKPFRLLFLKIIVIVLSKLGFKFVIAPELLKNLKDSDIFLHPNDHKKVNDWKQIFKFLEKNIDFKKIDSFLDLGAGTGDLGTFAIRKNPEIKVVCADINNEYLNIISKRNSSIKTLSYDINNQIPFDASNFDFVACLGTHHYGSVKKNINDLIVDLKRVSKKYILIDFFPNNSPYVFFQRIFYPNYNPRRYSQKEINNIILNNKLKIVSKIGTRTIFPKIMPFTGSTVFYLLEKI